MTRQRRRSVTFTPHHAVPETLFLVAQFKKERIVKGNQEKHTYI